eukprot:CAMPEP_0115032666 /NCGR_PEP_ID=MMETSP0216-20121206/39298_1 /TAXON_ID=223996 /ORGANISM="Protocruzia adherens, Strain Boccale" /LENGTH=272 /DNA_ID=CAMNT_0002410617 /DNA_START=22 /DNA_END=840 /DNA_ORIENTATION=-
MVLYFIGLGLGDEKDITVKGLEAIKSCDKVFLEMYTAILGIDKNRLSEFYGKEVIEADRNLVESGSDDIINQASTSNIAFLVVGDPFCATTHTDLFLRAKEQGVEIQVIHNASIMNAVASCGLQLYRFGEAVTIPFFTETWKPYSFFDKVLANFEHNLHTLVLLDIKVKEQTTENLLRGNNIFEPPRYMSCSVAAEQIIESIEQHENKSITADTICFGLARIGGVTQKIASAPLRDFVDQVDMGGPLHTLVIPAKEVHPLEEEMMKFYSDKK